MSCLALLCTLSIRPDKVYEERGRRVVMEMANTESPLRGWNFIAADAEGNAMLSTDFVEGGESYGVYYTYISCED